MTGEAKRPRAALYVRVSKGKGAQSQIPQFQALREMCEARSWRVVAVYRDRASGVKDRAGLRRALHDAAMRRFDVLAVWALDRFGRTALEVLTRAQELHARGVGFVSLKESAIDTSSAAGSLILTVMAAVAGFERQRLIERTREALDSRKRAGVRLGRPRLTGAIDLEAVRARLAAGESLAAVARTLTVIPRRGAAARPVSVRTLRRMLRG